MRLIFTCILAFFSVGIASAQLEKTIHQTFDLGEAKTISLDLFGSYTLVPWASDNLMTETQIQLYGATPAILNHLVEKNNRYNIEADTIGGNIKLVSFDKKREPVRTKTHPDGCTERVKLKVFVPEKFSVTDSTTLVRMN
ncbi:MAG: hypothetical protein AAB316_08490 [Bacteroidota bacterium]